jgi:hypothetical protein
MKTKTKPKQEDNLFLLLLLCLQNEVVLDAQRRFCETCDVGGDDHFFVSIHTEVNHGDRSALLSYKPRKQKKFLSKVLQPKPASYITNSDPSQKYF